MRLRFLRAAAPHWHTRQISTFWVLFPIGVVAVVLSSFVLVRATPHASPPPAIRAARIPVPLAPASPDAPVAKVWMVEQAGGSETYSNGLRIDNRYSNSNHARSYIAFPADRPEARGTRRSEPAGIVFHSTESLQAPFEAQQNRVLKRLGESLLEYVRRRHAYNFVIDRFGRVYRMVKESDAAEHAGYSVWSDTKWTYVNLNESFLGVSFEARTAPAPEEQEISPAQVRAAAMLTEMLRSRYAIPAANCVTHGQVSVNPSNMRMGYHRDWAAGFPFERFGLPNNYGQALPALWAFGFTCDRDFLRTAGTGIQQGVDRAEEMIRASAEGSGMTPREYRQLLHRRYRERLAETRGKYSRLETGVPD